jgi:SAM-dependent methyltransferase
LKYKYAVFKAVKPGDVVIDFGCGTGVLGFFALQAGARHVFAIEETPIIEFAQKLAIRNNFEDKITFIHKSGIDVKEEDIPEKVDLLVSEPISNLLLEGTAWSSIEYLKRFLKKDGVILPVSGKLFVVPVNSPPETYHDANRFIGGENVYNIDFLGLPSSVFYSSSIKQDSWLAKPQILLEINLLEEKLSDSFQKARIFENIFISSKEQPEYPSWSPIFAPVSYSTSFCPDDSLRVNIWNKILGPYRNDWIFEFTHHSKLLALEDVWWKSDSAIPKIAPGVILSKNGLLRLKQDDYFQYDCDNDLEVDFIQLFPKDLACSEICQTVFESKKYNLTYDAIFENLIKLLHKLLRNALIQLPVPYERFRVTKFQSILRIP